MPFCRKKTGFFPLIYFSASSLTWKPDIFWFTLMHISAFLESCLGYVLTAKWLRKQNLHPPRGNANVTTLWECSTSVISPLLPTFIFFQHPFEVTAFLHNIFYMLLSCTTALSVQQIKTFALLQHSLRWTQKPALVFPCFLKENGTKKKLGGMYSTSWQACFCLERCRSCQRVLDLCENNTYVLQPRSISSVHWAGKWKFIT